MKNKIVSFIVAMVAIFAFTVSSASAFDLSSLEGWYVSPKVGMTFQQFDDVHGKHNVSYSHRHDQAVLAGVSAGYDWSKSNFAIPFRTELEYLYRGNQDIALADRNLGFETHTVFANVAYDFKEVPYVTPYLTAGVGANWFTGTGSTYKFAYNFGGGVAVPVTDHISLDLSARYVDLGRMLKYSTKACTNGADVALAVRYTF